MRRLGGLLLALVLGSVVGAAGGETVPEETPTRDDGRRTLGRFVPNLGRAAIGVFHRDNLGPFFAGAMATSFAAIYDDEVAESIADPDSDFGKWVGEGTGRSAGPRSA